ncbi:flagellar assembly protein FliH [Bacillaceae bacterium Marseille-Q3522]|nr:flagellar assembly protein FliH [Bacillaceae bacterium Marseille-Q3522]
MSRLIKSQYANQNLHSGKKVISIKTFERQKKENQSHEKDIAHVNQECERILQSANEKAAEIILAAKEEASQVQKNIDKAKRLWEEEKKVIKEQVQKTAYEDGIREGINKGYEEMHLNILNAENVVKAAKTDYQKKVNEAEQTILELAIAVAEKITAAEIAENEENYLSLVKQAIKTMKESHEIQIHVHPSHYDFVLSHKEELQSIFLKTEEIYIYPNDELAENGCWIESSAGRMDVSVDSQLAEIKNKLYELLECESGDEGN